jgi:hypothetical protein
VIRNSASNVDADSGAEEKRVSNPNLLPVHRKKEDTPSEPQALIQVKADLHDTAGQEESDESSECTDEASFQLPPGFRVAADAPDEGALQVRCWR